MSNASDLCFLSVEAQSAIARRLGLSTRESQIVRLLLGDESEGAMARQLGISSHTVHTHLERLYRKLDVSSRCQVVVRVFQEYVRLEALQLHSPPLRSRQPTSRLVKRLLL